MVKSPKRYPEMREPRARPRYVGPATFFRARQSETFDDVDIGVIGVPFDGGVTHRPGARHGPRAVREQSTLIRRVNQATGVDPFALAHVADLGDAWVEEPFELTGALSEIEDFYSAVRSAGVVPLSVGGDHSISLAILRAVAKGGPLGMVHVDAHCDTGDDYLGSRFHHGAPFRRAVEEGLLDPRRVIQMGVRGSLGAADAWAFSYESGMRVVTIEEFSDRGWRWAADRPTATLALKETHDSFIRAGLG